MAPWARRYGQLFAQWHLLGAASNGAVNRGLLTAACGENLGDEERAIERVEDESIVGNRCPACQGIGLRAVSVSSQRVHVEGGLAPAHLDRPPIESSRVE